MKSFAKNPPAPTKPPEVFLDTSGTWKYADTDIPAVGARDVTLADAVHPPLVARSGEEPEAVLLSLTEVESDERLHWVFKKGTKLKGGEEPCYRVAWPVWQEHSSDPVGAWLPEWDGSGLDRALALGERRWRLAKQALDEAGVLRQSLVVLAGRLGRSRRLVGEVLGVSPARIQQLSEAPPAEIAAQVDAFAAAAATIAAAIGVETFAREDLPRPREYGADEFGELVDSMLAVGLMDESAAGLSLSEDGRALLGAKEVQRKPVESDRDRERAGNATR